jgi:hypothetical protein
MFRVSCHCIKAVRAASRQPVIARESWWMGYQRDKDTASPRVFIEFLFFDLFLEPVRQRPIGKMTNSAAKPITTVQREPNGAFSFQQLNSEPERNHPP